MFWNKPPIVQPEAIDGIYALFRIDQTDRPIFFAFDKGKLTNAIRPQSSDCRYTEGKLKISGAKFKFIFSLVEKTGPGDYDYKTLANITWKGTIIDSDAINIIEVVDLGDGYNTKKPAKLLKVDSIEE